MPSHTKKERAKKDASAIESMARVLSDITKRSGIGLAIKQAVQRRGKKKSKK